jgi:hypothetical protein
MITELIASQIYDILVEECGAPQSLREMFISYITTASGMLEFRYQGHLGFGGKFYASNWARWRTDCYIENKDSVRAAMIDRANRRLFKLWMKHNPPPMSR